MNYLMACAATNLQNFYCSFFSTLQYCAEKVLKKWKFRLGDAAVYTKSHCGVAIAAIRVD